MYGHVSPSEPAQEEGECGSVRPFEQRGRVGTCVVPHGHSKSGYISSHKTPTRAVIEEEKRGNGEEVRGKRGEEQT